MAQGWNSYFMVSEEGTQNGTEADDWGKDSGLFNTFQYHTSESMTSANEQKFLIEMGRSGTQDRQVKRHRILGKKCEGSVTFPVYPEGGGDKGGIALLLKHAFGDIITGTFSGDGTYLHSAVPNDNMFGNLAASNGSLVGTGRVYGLSVHIGREDDAGTIRDYPYLGCRIRSINFSCAAGEELMCTVEFVGRVAKAHATAKATAFSTMAPFMFKDASFQLGVDEAGASGTVRTIDSFDITIANNFTEIWSLGTEVLGRVVPSGQCTITGSYSAPYSNWMRTEHAAWKAGTSSSVNMSFAIGPYRLEFRLPNIYYTGSAPNVGGMEEQVIEFPFQGLVSSEFAVKAFVINTDSCVAHGIT